MREQSSEIKQKIKKYRAAVAAAGNEEIKRQRFVALLQELFGEMKDAKGIIEEFIAGAETPITQIKRVGKRSERGRADTQYGSVIIEFEKDLEKTREHAKQQLSDYVSGNWNSGSEYNFVLIASDCLRWEIYIPDIDAPVSGSKIFSCDVVLKQKKTFTLTDTNGLDFYYFLDALLFNTEKKKPTLAAIRRDFGADSNALITAISQLTGYFERAKHSGDVAVAYEQWKRFLSIAYDSFDSSEQVFLIHTYLSVFAKMLTYAILTPAGFIDGEKTKGILSGESFERLHIENFTEDDFFHWVAKEEALAALGPMFRAIAAEFDSYDFGHIDEDILKGIYQDLIDRDTRHALGEYYTPDWLCETVVNELQFESTSRVLDPSCGSGSFLRTAIDRFNREFPDLTADQIASQISGIDIHPLSVQISKATVLIALKDKIQTSPRPVFLSVYLANTLHSPTGAAAIDLFGGTFDILIDDQKISINTKIFDNPLQFEKAVHFAEQTADLTKDSPLLERAEFKKALKIQIEDGLKDFLINDIYDIYKALKHVKECDRDSIWKFIVLNLYKPCFFHQAFDFVVGNPPWFTYASIGNSNYQALLRDKAKETGTWPEKQANAPNMEIAAIFLAHCTGYFLRDKGQLAFVLPRSFFQADHHENTRSGMTESVRIKEIWDLEKVAPLFNVPSCVFFAEHAQGQGPQSRRIPDNGCKGRVFEGRLKEHNANLAEVQGAISSKPTRFYYSTLGAASAFSTTKRKMSNQANEYKELFRQGATLVPRNFYFIEPTQTVEGALKGQIFTAQTSDATNAQAKKPWKGIKMTGRICGDYLFRTALAQNVLPFVLHAPPMVLLPAKMTDNGTLCMLSSRELLKEGAADTAKWFQKVEGEWETKRTESSATMSNLGRLDFNKGLTKQHLAKRYIVMYTGSAKDANAVVLDRQALDLEFIADCTVYFLSCTSISEAHYLCSFLNSNFANERMKDFQARGLFGPRHVHRKILDVGLARFDKENPTHMKIADLSKTCHAKASKYVSDKKPAQNMSPPALGKHRLQIRENLKMELEKIDAVFDEI